MDPMPYMDVVLEELNHAFSTLYHRVFKRHWHNGVYSYMPRNYADTDFQSGVYAVAYPTFPDRYGMRYSLINVKVFDKPITQEEADAWFKQLYREGLVKPNGAVDSRCHIVIAPASADRRHLKGCYRARGTMHLLVVDPDPLRAVVRVIRQVLTFIACRLKGFFNKTHLDHLWGEFYTSQLLTPADSADEEDKGLWTSIKNILSRRSIEILANSVMCLTRLFRRLSQSLREVMRKFGFVNTHIRPVRPEPEKVKLMVENPPLLMEIERTLRLQLNVIRKRLRELEDVKRASNILTGRYEVI